MKEQNLSSSADAQGISKPNISERKKAVLLSLFITIMTIFMTIFYNRNAYRIAETVDNIIISMITNCLFSSENYCLVLSPVLCALIKLMHYIIPSADNFVLYMRLCVWAATMFTGFAAFRLAGNRQKQTFIAILWGALAGCCIANMNFTVSAGFLSACGFICLALSKKAGSKKKHFIAAGTLLIFLGGMLRFEAILLTVPFAAVYFLSEMYIEKKFKKNIVILIPAFLCVFFLYISNYVTIHSEKYHEAVQYNNARSSITDRPLKSYEEIKDALPDVTNIDMAWLLTFGDTERMNTAFLERIAAAAQKRPYAPNEIPKMISDMLALNFGAVFYIVLSLVLISALMIIFSDCHAIYKTEAAAGLLGILLFGCMFMYIGRLLTRIYLPVVISCLALNIAVLCSIRCSNAGKKNIHRLLLFLAGISFVSSVIRYMSVEFSPHPTLALTASANAEDSVFRGTYIDDAVIIWDTTYFDGIALTYFNENGKLPTQEFMKHNITFGDWTYGQLYLKEYWDKLGIQNPVYDLLCRDNTFYVGPCLQLTLQYIHQNIDPNAAAIQCGTIGDTEIWKIIPGDELVNYQ